MKKAVLLGFILWQVHRGGATGAMATHATALDGFNTETECVKHIVVLNKNSERMGIPPALDYECWPAATSPTYRDNAAKRGARPR